MLIQVKKLCVLSGVKIQHDIAIIYCPFLYNNIKWYHLESNSMVWSANEIQKPDC